MQEMKVIGMRGYDFTAKDGKHLEGQKIYCTYEDKQIAGLACEAISISLEKLGSKLVSLDDTIRPIYNRFGKIDCIEILD